MTLNNNSSSRLLVLNNYTLRTHYERHESFVRRPCEFSFVRRSKIRQSTPCSIHIVTSSALLSCRTYRHSINGVNQVIGRTMIDMWIIVRGGNKLCLECDAHIKDISALPMGLWVKYWVMVNIKLSDLATIEYLLLIQSKLWEQNHKKHYDSPRNLTQSQ